ncbi:phosphatidate cytidylyltransferase, mitochondrial [Microcaecilia unicolor]|uniref:Phosphatidate cytidylyltransferase, mitochondrial n=1 Tax=Microcaecilia unicolor TaxID=1415580 RepID=A0A6P7YAU8_9AMPH|nr:phosphatidate cytidylyltransferase, mitochondrial [Microcaecilia unicolor]
MLPALESTGFTLRKILSCFPQDISLAFAYGSGVFRQSGTSHSQNNMMDFVFAVDDPITWHGMNIKQNRSHYSFLKYFGPKKISGLQNNYGAGVYYNTLVPCDGKIIKYGVVSTKTLIEDLLHWKSLYIAGRLHKPVKFLAQNENERLQTALNSNLKSALTVAFLMLPESFSEEDLYLQVAGLSYFGDFRMIIGEDRSKVLNIVKPNMLHFQKLYSSILHECPDVVYKQHQGKLEIDKSPEGQLTKLMSLPKNLQQNITTLIETAGKNRDVEELLLQIAQDPDCGLVIRHGVSEIVKSSSLSQSAKGILTAGFRKTVAYSLKKLYKMCKGYRRKNTQNSLSSTHLQK